MKAYVRIGSRNNRVELMDIDITSIDNHEVLIQVKALGVGVHDRYFIPRDVTFPYAIGIEGAGVIVKVGDQVKNFQVGDRVVFSSSMQPKGGSWAEYVAV